MADVQVDVVHLGLIHLLETVKFLILGFHLLLHQVHLLPHLLDLFEVRTIHTVPSSSIHNGLEHPNSLLKKFHRLHLLGLH